MDQTVRIRYKGEQLEVPRNILNKYRKFLSESPHYSVANVDVHMSFLYSGNRIPVREFLTWYKIQGYPPLSPVA